MSAALMGTGQLDAQMVFLYGNTVGPSPEPGQPGFGMFDELARARGLCKWVQDNNVGGPGWGVEGMVRMNAGFELMWCNFTSPSISHLNATTPLLPESALDELEHTTSIDQQFPGKLISEIGGALNSIKSVFPLPSSTIRRATPQTDRV
jgi:hypothetical protein